MVCTARVRHAIRNDEVLKHYLGHEEELCRGAMIGGELEWGFNEWLERIRNSTVLIDENEYLLAVLFAVIAISKKRVSRIDFGLPRRRDWGHIATDLIRANLGTIAVYKYLEKDIVSGRIVPYPVAKAARDVRIPYDFVRVDDRYKQRFNVYTGKLSSGWLIVPKERLLHYDSFIMVKLGVTLDHFASFIFKKYQLSRDLIIAAQNLSIDRRTLEDAFSRIPEFKTIPAYIVGYITPSEYGIMRKRAVVEIRIRGREIVEYLGLFGTERARVEAERILHTTIRWDKISFRGIGRPLQREVFIANTKFLKPIK